MIIKQATKDPNKGTKEINYFFHNAICMYVL